MGFRSQLNLSENNFVDTPVTLPLLGFFENDSTEGGGAGGWGGGGGGGVTDGS